MKLIGTQDLSCMLSSELVCDNPTMLCDNGNLDFLLNVD